MKCPVCQGRLTITAGHDGNLLLICKRRVVGPTDSCSYAIEDWEVPGLYEALDKLFDDFLDKFEPKGVADE